MRGRGRSYCATERQSQQEVSIRSLLFIIRENDDFLAATENAITGNEFPPPSQFHNAIDKHLARLDEEFRLTARGDALGEFQELVQANRVCVVVRHRQNLNGGRPKR